MQGTIKFFNETKGFGFIVPEDGSADMFVHITECEEGWLPEEGNVVAYEVGSGKDGRPAASNVSLVSAQGADDTADVE